MSQNYNADGTGASADHPHQEIALVKTYEDGSRDVVAYFAPNFEINPVMKNNLFSADRPRGRGTVVRDNQLYRFEIILQGTFEDSRNLPTVHEYELLALDDDWDEYVTPRMQVNRIKEFLMNEGGPFELYEGEDEYTAYEMEDADYANGRFPTVQVDEFRPTRDMGSPRWEYMVKFIVGEDTGVDDPTKPEQEDDGSWWNPFD